MTMKKKLDNVTLLGIDCVDIDRLTLAANICQENFEFADVKLLTSIESNEHKNIVNIDPIKNIDEYSLFMISRLHEFVDTEFVLIFQYDGFILNPNAWTDEFLKYDYIGSPWLVQDWSLRFGFTKEMIGTMMVGNGGFCIRSKKLIQFTSQLHEAGNLEKYNPEDIAICLWNKDLIEKNGFKIAPVSLAKKFGFEGENDESDKWNGQFGFHGFRWTDISNWIKDHPEYIVDREKNTFTYIGK
jgi:hypothetical protein